MGLFFEGERKPKIVVVPDPVDMEKALIAVSKRLSAHDVAAAGGIDLDRARHLIQECRKVEPLLTAAIKDLSVKTKTEANTFVTANTEAPFPVVKFLAICQNRLDTVDGGGAPVSATWADVVAAYKSEE